MFFQGDVDGAVMPIGELLVRWTVRLAMACYVISLATRGYAPRSSRLAWTGGCIAYLLHVAAAFEYYHDWSHANAYAFTALQTNNVVGIGWGDGIWFNYAFTAIWIGDALAWWLNAERYLARPRWIDWSIHAYLGFLAFNATVVFATGFSRCFGVASCGMLIIVLGISAWRRREM